ncbi:MAG: NAD(P)H-dependent oxidoreductase [Ignavibacteriales bacterium]|nr:NAD(P)H-dependent oxidoreductase [Ignavibacteriales bacterium]
MTIKTLDILAFAGSLRSESFNRKALQIAKQIAVELNTNVVDLDLKTLNLPLFDADLRANGFPESVKKLKDAIASADILLIATPEYNHSIPGVLKNAIDWASDKTNPFDGKVAAIFGASNGLFGTLRAQLHLRQVLAALNVELVPQPQVFIRFAQSAFLPDGSLVDQRIKQQLRHLIEATLTLAYRKQESRKSLENVQSADIVGT